MTISEFVHVTKHFYTFKSGLVELSNYVKILKNMAVLAIPAVVALKKLSDRGNTKGDFFFVVCPHNPKISTV